MSHFTSIKTKLYDRATIEKSLSDLNIKCETEVNKVRGYKNQEEFAEIVIRQNNNHDIGFRWNGKEYEKVPTWILSTMFKNMPEYKFKNSTWYD